MCPGRLALHADGTGVRLEAAMDTSSSSRGVPAETDRVPVPLWQKLALAAAAPRLGPMNPPRTMHFSILPVLAAFVQGRVASGRYRSASEVARAAWRLLDEDERRREAPVPARHAARQDHGAPDGA
jgi:antitoxin ParD1/3/4